MINDNNRKNRNNIIIFSIIWSIAIGILFFSLFQNLGYAKVINYSGVVRGATQRLVKKELTNQPDDNLIAYLDDLLYDLSTGEGNFDLVKIKDDDYQKQISNMFTKWDSIKYEIKNLRTGSSSDNLFALSEEYFYDADTMVHYAELHSNKQLKQIILFLLLYLVISMSAFILWYRIKQKEIQKVLYIDTLTGAYNLTGFEIATSNILEKHHEKNLAILCFDIDDFKFFNTSYGYSLGDSLLCIIANTIKNISIRTECCARSEADKFYLLVENHGQLLEQLESSIYSEIQNQFLLDITTDITFSFGGFIINDETNARQIIDYVNLAHKNSKISRMENIIWYDNTLMQKLLDDNQKLKKMHKSLDDGDFLLYLQPKFDISNRNIIGAEALVRWQFSDEILLYPDSFIPLFEKNGVIHDLDFYMLKKTCEFIKNHALGKGDFKISINFSRVTLYRKNFSEMLFSILEIYQVPVTCLEIEITESAINGLSDSIITLLQDLRDRGLIISMDDFGSGYSSLSLLSSLPIDIIKIDKEFLLDKRNEKSVRDVLDLIIRVAHSLNICVICEGVETEYHAELLKQLSCDYGQGYLISKPIDEQAFKDKFL